VYEVGLINSDYGYSTAVGLFNSVINVILIVTANQLSKKLADESLF
jgi:putative aldouronate transport system permease protein